MSLFSTYNIDTKVDDPIVYIHDYSPKLPNRATIRFVYVSMSDSIVYKEVVYYIKFSFNSIRSVRKTQHDINKKYTLDKAGNILLDNSSTKVFSELNFKKNINRFITDEQCLIIDSKFLDMDNVNKILRLNELQAIKSK